MTFRRFFISTALLFTTVMSAPTAHAHAALESTFPAKGSVVAKSTNHVALLFGEDILVLKGKKPNSISVTDSRGTKVNSGDAIVSGSKVSTSLKAPLNSGRYSVAYRVVSADGHVVTGSFTFTVK